MPNKFFGTDGVRGVANTFPMTVEFAFRLARVLSQKVCYVRKRVALARDTRVSGDMIEAALTAGFTSMGVDVVRMGIVPTPLVTSQVGDLNVDMALMITASHNPYYDNGIKLINHYGDKFSDEETAKIEELLVSDKNFDVSKDSIGRVFDDELSISAYMRQAMKIAPNYNALKGLKVVLDCANGAFSKMMPTIFKNLGAGVITLSDKPDGYNINKDCGSQHTENLQKVVTESHAHLGIAVDGDGDRIVVCDENGQRIDGDQIIAFLATYLHAHQKLGNNTVVATIWSNMGLEKYLHSYGIRFCRTPVGERYVIEKMRETSARLGGEESGHIVLADYSKTGDALLTAVLFSVALVESSKKMSEIFPLFEKYPCRIDNIRFASPDEAQYALNSASLQKVIANVKELLASKGNFIVRKSGTEPVLKVRVESNDAGLTDRVADMIVEEIEKYK